MGKKQFSQVTSIGSVESSSIELVQILDETAVVAGGTLSKEIYAPEGHFARVNSFVVVCGKTNGATAGTQSIDIFPTVYEIGIYMSGSSNYNNLQGLRFAHMYWESADASQLPASPEAQAICASNMIFNDTMGLRIKYTNGTTGGTNTYRDYCFIIEKTRTAQSM